MICSVQVSLITCYFIVCLRVLAGGGLIYKFKTLDLSLSSPVQYKAPITATTITGSPADSSITHWTTFPLTFFRETFRFILRYSSLSLYVTAANCSKTTEYHNSIRQRWQHFQTVLITPLRNLTECFLYFCFPVYEYSEEIWGPLQTTTACSVSVCSEEPTWSISILERGLNLLDHVTYCNAFVVPVMEIFHKHLT